MDDPVESFSMRSSLPLVSLCWGAGCHHGHRPARIGCGDGLQGMWYIN